MSLLETLNDLFRSPPSWLGDVANFLGTLVAAFAGAWVAFRFESSNRAKDRTDEEIVAGNLALLGLSEIWNVLRDYQTGVVEKWRGKPGDWLSLEASPPINFGGVSFDTRGLSFLLEGHPEAVQRLLLERRRFNLAIQMINDRSELVRSEVFPRLTRAGVKLDDGKSEPEIEQILGVGIARQLRMLTSGIIADVDEDVRSSRDAFNQLRAVLKAMHPKRKFIDLTRE
jgi:hypothetical protein